MRTLVVGELIGGPVEEPKTALRDDGSIPDPDAVVIDAPNLPIDPAMSMISVDRMTGIDGVGQIEDHRSPVHYFASTDCAPTNSPSRNRNSRFVIGALP